MLPPPVPIARIELVTAPAPAASAPAIAPTAPIAAAPPAPVESPVRPERHEERSDEWSRGIADFAATLHTSLAFADAALAVLPHPSEVVTGDPAAPDVPPGPAPAGDARSLRAGDQFALVYRHGAAVVTRRGTLGQRGAWRVVDYPSPALAAHAYALECSRLVAQGFRDLSAVS